MESADNRKRSARPVIRWHLVLGFVVASVLIAGGAYFSVWYQGHRVLRMMPHHITTASATADAGTVVYVTRTGTVYHASASCQYCRSSCIEGRLGDARARGLTPCSACWGKR